MKLVEDTLEYPYSAIGLITGKYKKDKKKTLQYCGSGSLIGNNIVLTCAHNVFNK